MAERKSGADFVARIVKDPANPPQTAMLTGYVGASSEPKHTRLYFEPGLSSYVEIPDDAILHTQDSGDPGGLGGTHVWVRRDAELIYGPAGAQRPKGKFLEGPIMQANMGAAAAAGALPTPTVTVWIGCMQTRVAPCPPQSDFVACQTPAMGCPPTLYAPCLSHLPCPSVPCPPSDFVPCQTPAMGCPPTLHAPCLSHAPCPSVPCLTPHLPCPTHLGCPTHAPFLCPTPPVVCASAHLGCPTHAPFMCPITVQCPAR
jgi:hypothetical protein